MKKLIISLAIALLQFGSSAIAADSDTLTVRIKAMRCDDCAHKVMTALTKNSGVEDVQFNLERRTASIIYNPDAVTPDTLCAILDATRRYKASPYSPDEVIRRGIGFRIDDMHCKKCSDRITGRLNEMQGIDSIAPHLDKHYIFVRYDANRTTKDSIRTAINELGYTPVNYYTSDNIAFAYYNIKGKMPSQEAIDEVLTISAVEDVNVNTLRHTMAVTYFSKEISAERLHKAIRKAGIKAVVPPPHICKD